MSGQSPKVIDLLGWLQARLGGAPVLEKSQPCTRGPQAAQVSASSPPHSSVEYRPGSPCWDVAPEPEEGLTIPAAPWQEWPEFRQRAVQDEGLPPFEGPLKAE